MNDYINFSISKSEAMVIFRLGLNTFHFCKLYLSCKFKYKSLRLSCNCEMICAKMNRSSWLRSRVVYWTWFIILMYFSAHIHKHMRWLLQKIPNAALESIYRCSSLLTIAKIRLPSSSRSSWMYRELKLKEVKTHTSLRYSIVSLSHVCVIGGWNLFVIEHLYAFTVKHTKSTCVWNLPHK